MHMHMPPRINGSYKDLSVFVQHCPPASRTTISPGCLTALASTLLAARHPIGPSRRSGTASASTGPGTGPSGRTAIQSQHGRCLASSGSKHTQPRHSRQRWPSPPARDR